MSEICCWSRLNHMQLGRYAEYMSKMRFVLHGFEVYTSEIDDRGIDFVLRHESGLYWDVQVKSSRNYNYVFMKKSKFRIRPNLLLVLALFDDGREPDLFLIPAARWLQQPDPVFVDHSYEGLKSKPEYGVNLSARGIRELEPFQFGPALERMLGEMGLADASDAGRPPCNPV